MVPVAASAPAANSNESPGRNGVTTRPVSAKMTAKSPAYDQRAVLRDKISEVNVEVEKEVDDVIHARR